MLVHACIHVHVCKYMYMPTFHHECNSWRTYVVLKVQLAMMEAALWVEADLMCTLCYSWHQTHTEDM